MPARFGKDRSGAAAVHFTDPDSAKAGQTGAVLQLALDPTLQRFLGAGLVLLGLAGLGAAAIMARQARRDARRERLKRRV
jgi:hypothetical protein